MIVGFANVKNRSIKSTVGRIILRSFLVSL